MGDVDPDPDEPEQRNSGLPPLPSVKSAFLEHGWSSRPPAGPAAPVPVAMPKAPTAPNLAAVPNAAAAPMPPPAFPPSNKTLAGLPLPPAVKWTPEVHNEAPSVKPAAPAPQPYRGEPRLPVAAAVPLAPPAAVPPPTAPAAVSMEAALFPGSRPPPVPSTAPAMPQPTMQQVAPVQSPLAQAGSQVPGAFSQTAPMAAVVLPGGAALPGTAGSLTSSEAAAGPVAPALQGPSVDVEEFTRASKGGAGGWISALFASKPRVAGVFFVLGVLVTLGAQAFFGSDTARTREAALNPDKVEEAKTEPKAPAAAAKVDDHTDKAAEKVEDKVEPPPAPSAAASAEPAEPTAEEEEPASPTKSTKTSAPAKFNKTAATKAMSGAASQAARCKSSGKGGPAKVTATFAPTGKVSLVQIISGRFDSKTLACIRSAFQAARVPAFTGKPEAVTKSFTVK